jgi:YidC/Oxa1 family membrane protein insertase
MLTNTPRRVSRWALLGGVLLLLTLLLAGCGGPTAKPLGTGEFADLGKELAAIEQMPAAKFKDYDKQLNGEALATEDKAIKAHKTLLRGYVEEVQATRAEPELLKRDYSIARTRYQDALTNGGSYATQARYQLGILAAHGTLGARAESIKLAKNELKILERAFGTPIWVRTPQLAGEGGNAQVVATTTPGTATPQLASADAAAASAQELDTIYKTSGGLDAVYYRVVESYISWFKKISPPGYGAAIALIFLALIIKLVTMPMTTASFRGMRDMQRVQPLIKELQEKYKDDKAKLAEAQMTLMKEHKVSPLGGCLPMLIQLPIFIVVYQAVLVYAAGFADAKFFWVHNLAKPDMILLILYALSMIVTQKLTATPANDPQQKMMQTQMTYMMPIMLYFLLQTMASAFVLYWFFLNVFSAIHQYYLMKKFALEDAARAPQTAIIEAPSKKKGTKK